MYAALVDCCIGKYLGLTQNKMRDPYLNSMFHKKKIIVLPFPTINKLSCCSREGYA